jgi:prepilin-type N-terminal cleavage/methylation domain-containing protein
MSAAQKTSVPLSSSLPAERGERGAGNQFRLRPARRGLTLTEVLVTVVIISVSLIGMVSSWLYMINSAVNTDDRAAAYICARTVLERAKVNGFFLVQPATVSAPRGGNLSRSTWVTSNLAAERFFDANLEELPIGGRTRPVALYARYRVTTEVTYSPAGTYPQGREDLRVMTVTVRAYRYGGSTELAKLQTCMVQGGI